MNPLIPPGYIPCTVKRPPTNLMIEAARMAVAENPSNHAPLERLAAVLPGVQLTPDHLALSTSRFWGAAGVKLGVAFLDTNETALKTRILSHANAWGNRANVTFAEASAALAQIRVLRLPGDGYWSYLGTDILSIPFGQPTMNLDSFSMQTPDSEFFRVVRHEFGHTLGFIHEHLRAEIIKRLDRAKTIALFQATQHWSAPEVIAQVLTPQDERTLKATPHADVRSIMCYELPGTITIDGIPIPGGLDIDESDYEEAAKLYPLPTPPPSGADFVDIPAAGRYQRVT